MQKASNEKMREILRMVGNPAISKFIDLNKLRRSDEFTMICKCASQHAKETGDVGFMLKILRLFEGTIHLNDVANRLREESNLLIVRYKGEILVKKKTKIDAEVDSKCAIDLKSKRAIHEKTYIDALDHPARLPGSYGSGKRR